MPNTLYDYYKEKGQSLPSVAERAPLAAQYGINNYTGTAEQNTALLQKLTAAAGAAPAALPPVTPEEKSPAPEDQQANAIGELGNLRIALRSALNEAGKNRVAKNYGIVAGTGTAPGTVGSVVDMIKSGVKSTAEQTFSDIVESYKNATEAKQKEIDRINQLREEYGSLVPSSVTDLKTALDLIAPAVDKERKLAFDKMAKDLTSGQEEDDDIQSWAESYARGEIAIGNVPLKIRSAVKIAADKIKAQLEIEAKQEYKDSIAFRLERKTSNYDTERTLALQDDNLSVAEQREILDYIDGLEAAAQAAKKSGGFLGMGGAKTERVYGGTAQSTPEILRAPTKPLSAAPAPTGDWTKGF